jgi:hypothetical protein
MIGRESRGQKATGEAEGRPIGGGDQEEPVRHWLSRRRINHGRTKDGIGERAQNDNSHDTGKDGGDAFQGKFHSGRSFHPVLQPEFRIRCQIPSSSRGR